LYYNRKLAPLGIMQEDYCSFLPSLEQSGFTNVFRPTPVVGRLDLASAFFSADQLGKETTAFGELHPLVWLHACLWLGFVTWSVVPRAGSQYVRLVLRSTHNV
jgi:hypothetical protein